MLSGGTHLRSPLSLSLRCSLSLLNSADLVSRREQALTCIFDPALWAAHLTAMPHPRSANAHQVSVVAGRSNSVSFDNCYSCAKGPHGHLEVEHVHANLGIVLVQLVERPDLDEQDDVLVL